MENGFLRKRLILLTNTNSFSLIMFFGDSKMTSALIPVFKTDFNVQTIDARELHKFLGVGQRFNDWIKNRISKYEFEECKDFVIHKTMSQENQQVTNNINDKIDYHISIDMAKELAMVERNAKGKEARQYFIQCEKELMKNIKPMTTAELAVFTVNTLLEQERQIADIRVNQSLLTSKINSIEAESKRLRSHSDFYTIVAFCNIVNFAITTKTAAKIGKETTKFCKDNNLQIDKTSDVRYGFVNVYPIDALVTVCSQLFPSHNFDVIYI